MSKRKYEDPPLVDVKVTNPVTYIKRWWGKVIGNEGVEFRFSIKPLTAIAISAVIATVGFGFGHFVFPENIPFFKYTEVSPTPKTEAETWKDTAYIGTLKFSNTTGKYYLVTSSAAEAISLQVPGNLDLSSLIEKRIMVAGRYSKSLRVIVVSDANNMEVLPKSPVAIPTTTPTYNPTPTQASTSSGILDIIGQ